jgi:hypothetical protein
VRARGRRERAPTSGPGASAWEIRRGSSARARGGLGRVRPTRGGERRKEARERKGSTEPPAGPREKGKERGPREGRRVGLGWLGSLPSFFFFPFSFLYPNYSNKTI